LALQLAKEMFFSSPGED